jgi:hypothetical protein
MRLKNRRVEIAGFTAHRDFAWMTQVGRNLTDRADAFVRDSGHLIVDRDTKYLPLCEMLKGTESRVVRLPPKSRQLGHSQVTTTMNDYAHWIEEPRETRGVDRSDEICPVG